MHPQFKQIPPSSAFSTQATRFPNCAACTAASYPPGPDPITTTSNDSLATLSSGTVEESIGRGIVCEGQARAKSPTASVRGGRINGPQMNTNEHKQIRIKYLNTKARSP